MGEKTPREIYYMAIYADIDPSSKVSFEEFSSDLDAAGYVIVQIDPDEEMHAAADDGLANGLGMDDIFRDMCRASQTQKAATR